MEFELPKINVSFEYDKEKGEMVFVINGVEKRVKTEDIIKKLDEKQPRFIMHSDGSLEQIVEYCEDCISRKAVLDCFKKWQPYMATRIFEYEQELKALPIIQPKPKTGHWIEKDGLDGDTYYDCSECGESWTTIDGTPWNNGMKYCPNCGAKMESEG